MGFIDCSIMLAIVYVFIRFLGPRRHLESFLKPVASFSQSVGPWQAAATQFIPEITSDFRNSTPQITNIWELFLVC